MDQRQAKLNQRLDREAAFRAAKAEATRQRTGFGVLGIWTLTVLRNEDPLIGSDEDWWWLVMIDGKIEKNTTVFFLKNVQFSHGFIRLLIMLLLYCYQLVAISSWDHRTLFTLFPDPGLKTNVAGPDFLIV